MPRRTRRPNNLSSHQSAGGAWRSGPALLDAKEVNHGREEIQTGLQVRALRKRGRNDDYRHPGGRPASGSRTRRCAGSSGQDQRTFSHKEVIAAKSRAARQQKFSSPNRQSYVPGTNPDPNGIDLGLAGQRCRFRKLQIWKPLVMCLSPLSFEITSDYRGKGLSVIGRMKFQISPIFQ